jgi:hypothetical protein
MTDPVPQAMPDGPGVRALKFAVIAMGVLIVLGVLTVIGRIVYLANTRGTQAERPAGTSRLAPAARLALPATAHVRQISLSGDRLAVHYESSAGAGIAILDLATGSVLSRVDVVPEVPR